ncbi:MAG: response regulator, partial [Planctomycetes bacterium]|nr:response regulator [Planctomycetota bacterium]
GLGLRISNSIATMLGGGLQIESELGRGSTFTVTVATGPLAGVAMMDPRYCGVSPSPEPRLRDPDPAERALSGLRILLAEDGPDNQRLITHHLQRAGAEVIVACDGQVALDLLTEEGDEPFDLVVMDMQMPKLDGYSATRRLRQLGHTIPVIALTAHAMTEDRQKCLAAGCDDFQTKPIDKNELIEACRRRARPKTIRG